MLLITRQSLASTIGARWAQNYPPSELQTELANPRTNPKRRECIQEKLNIYRDLLALGTTPDPDEVDTIIGNDTWTRVPDCAQCTIISSQVVQFNQGEDDDMQTINFCKSCLERAVLLFCVDDARDDISQYNVHDDMTPGSWEKDE